MRKKWKIKASEIGSGKKYGMNLDPQKLGYSLNEKQIGKFPILRSSYRWMEDQI